VAELLAEVGYDSLTIEGVASRAGVAKTTLYRRWFTKQQLVIEALDVGAYARGPADTGSLRGDLCAHMQAASDVLSAPIGQAVIGLVSAARRHPELAEALRTNFFATRRAEMDEVLSRAAARSELAPGIDRQVLIDLIISPLWYRALLWDEAPAPAQLAALIDIVVSGCTRPASTGRLTVVDITDAQDLAYSLQLLT
jgi:AcrR family transcriptional regulator